MSEWRLIQDDGVGAAEGLAVDESLMGSYHDGPPPAPSLRLYTYRSHCALVGRFQDPRVELNLPACESEDVEVNRRPTGGGAIVMGSQQLGVALVTSLRDPATPAHARAIVDTFGRGVVLGLARLGVEGEIRGKNDVAVRGRKIAGLGIYTDHRDAVLFHASVLADLDVDLMLRILDIPVAKLGGDAPAAVRGRITTATAEAARPVTAGELRECIRAGFEEAFGVRTASRPLDAEEKAFAMEILSQRYGSPDWVFGRHESTAALPPEGTSILKTPGGIVRIGLRLGGDAIAHALVTGDFMARDRAIAEIEAALRWAAADKERVKAAVALGWERGGGLDGVACDDVVQAVWSAVLDARARRGMTSGSCYYPPATGPAAGTAEREEAAAWR